MKNIDVEKNFPINYSLLAPFTSNLITIKGVDTVYHNALYRHIIGRSGGQSGNVVFSIRDVENDHADFIVSTLNSLIIKGQGVPRDFDWGEEFDKFEKAQAKEDLSNLQNKAKTEEVSTRNGDSASSHTKTK